MANVNFQVDKETHVLLRRIMKRDKRGTLKNTVKVLAQDAWVKDGDRSSGDVAHSHELRAPALSN